MLRAVNTLALVVVISALVVTFSEVADAADGHTATALILVGRAPAALPGSSTAADGDYAIFKGTQVALIKSDLVLLAVARHTEDVPLLKKADDAVAWLRNRIHVESLDGTELISISLSGEEDPEQLRQIVREVVDAYCKEVRDTNRILKRTELDGLKSVYNQEKREYERQLRTYYQMSRSLESHGSTSARIDLEVIGNHLRRLDERRSKIEDRLDEVDLRAEIAKQAADKSAGDTATIEKKFWGERLDSVNSRVEELMKEAKKLNEPNAELDVLSDEIDQLRKAVNKLGDAIQQAEIMEDAKVPDRIQVIQPASISRADD